MINNSLIVLCANIFIELNKIKKVDKIYFEDVIKLSELLKDKWNNNLDIHDFIRLEYEYNLFFYFYEDYDGYIIKLANGIDIENLENYFNREIFKDQNLNSILSDINLEEIFLKKLKIKQG